jgi:L-threonylcarbamoyladenylate synthase
MRLLTVDPADPDPAVIAEAAGLLRAGGLVAFPTETVYGLGVDPFNAGAVGRLFVVKGRPAEKGLILHLGDVRQIEAIADPIPPAARALVRHFFPGPLTLVLRAKTGTGAPELSRRVTGGGETVAVRLPDHPVALALARAFGGPIAAPSANLSGEPPPTDAETVRRTLGPAIDAILDAGPTPGGVPSTLVDVTAAPIRILREGAIPSNAVWAALGGYDRSEIKDRPE